MLSLHGDQLRLVFSSEMSLGLDVYATIGSIYYEVRDVVTSEYIRNLLALILEEDFRSFKLAVYLLLELIPRAFQLLTIFFNVSFHRFLSAGTFFCPAQVQQPSRI